MMTLPDIKAIVRQETLFVSGHLCAAEHGNLPDGAKTLLLLSPDEPEFWPMFKASPEYRDKAPDPLNRWSEAALGRITRRITGAKAIFPFGGPPWHPFIGWALASGRTHSSPVGLMVHDTRGLFISFRAALALPYSLDLPRTPVASPCISCHAPCETACPVEAFSAGTYDVPKCKSHIQSPSGHDCLKTGCRVRRACPVGQDRRDSDQSAFHMRAFA